MSDTFRDASKRQIDELVRAGIPIPASVHQVLDIIERTDAAIIGGQKMIIVSYEDFASLLELVGEATALAVKP